MMHLRKWFSFSIRDLLWLMVVAAIVSGWYAQSLRWKIVREHMLSEQAAQKAELKKATEYKISMENLLFNEHLSHMMSSRDYCHNLIELLTDETSRPRIRQDLTQFEME